MDARRAAVKPQQCGMSVPASGGLSDGLMELAQGVAACDQTFGVGVSGNLDQRSLVLDARFAFRTRRFESGNDRARPAQLLVIGCQQAIDQRGMRRIDQATGWAGCGAAGPCEWPCGWLWSCPWEWEVTMPECYNVTLAKSIGPAAYAGLTPTDE